MGLFDRVAHTKAQLIRTLVELDADGEGFAGAYGLYREIAREELKQTLRVLIEHFKDEDEAYYYSLLDDFYVLHGNIKTKLTVEKLHKIMVLDIGFETYCKRQTGLVQYAAYKTQIKDTELLEAAIKLL